MVDWSKAPEGAEYYARGLFRKTGAKVWSSINLHWAPGSLSDDRAVDEPDYEVRPAAVFPDGVNQAMMDASTPCVGYSHMGRCPTLPLDFVAKAIAKSHKTAPDGIAQPPTNKYDRVIHGKYGTGQCTVDVYRVLNAFGPLSPEIDHAVKKLLAPGSRGHKDEKQDLLEAIQSIEARLQYLEAVNGGK